MLALLSNGGSSTSPQWSVPNAGYSANEDLVDVLTCIKITADSNGGVTAKSTQGMPQVRPTFTRSSFE